MEKAGVEETSAELGQENRGVFPSLVPVEFMDFGCVLRYCEQFLC